MSILVHFAGAATISSFTLVYAERLGATSGDLGIVSASFLVASTVATLFTVYLVEWQGYTITLILRALAMGVTLMLTPMMDDLRTFEDAQLLTGAGRGLLFTTLMALSINRVAPEQRASAMGVYQALYAIGMLACPAFGGIAAETLGIGTVFYIPGILVLMAGAIVFLPNRIVTRTAHQVANA